VTTHLGQEAAPESTEVISYEHLYRRWEQNPWSARDIDFSQDERDWREYLTDVQRRAALWNYAMFLVGEESVARTLTPVIDAAPHHEAAIFLATQIVDEARHHVFFDRFMREVASVGRDLPSTLDEARSYLTWGFVKIFEELDRVTDELRKKPRDQALLAQAIALYHIVIEGTLAVPAQHFIQRYVRELGIMPGFSYGINNVSRDESRHVAFGVKLLGELVSGSRECRAAAIELWDRALRWAAGVFIPPGFDTSYAESLGFTLEDIYAFGVRSFETKVRRIGVEPAEIPLLKLENAGLPYDERARRFWVLIRAGVIGDDRRTPEPTPEALSILFDSMARAARPEVARAFDRPVEWRFTDGRPTWHVRFTDGRAEAIEGAAPGRAVRIRARSSDLALIAMGRADPRRLAATRRLKVSGPPRLLLKLPKLFETA
jgi:hypothetical protein